MIYLDNAASSWPKPPGVVERTQEWIGENGANPGRSNHRPARRAGRWLERPGLAPFSAIHSRVRSRTAGGLGQDDAALSR